MEMVIFVGLPASGKSTHFKEKYVDTHIRINLDMLKTRRREGILLDACFKAKLRVVIDNTNVTIKEREKYLKMAANNKYETLVVYFDTPLEVCLERNANREAKIAKVAIYTKNKRFEEPQLSEGIDHISRIWSDS